MVSPMLLRWDMAEIEIATATRGSSCTEAGTLMWLTFCMFLNLDTSYYIYVAAKYYKTVFGWRWRLQLDSDDDVVGAVTFKCWHLLPLVCCINMSELLAQPHVRMLPSISLIASHTLCQVHLAILPYSGGSGILWGQVLLAHHGQIKCICMSA